MYPKPNNGFSQVSFKAKTEMEGHFKSCNLSFIRKTCLAIHRKYSPCGRVLKLQGPLLL
jgi:hypothetical protein